MKWTAPMLVGTQDTNEVTNQDFNAMLAKNAVDVTPDKPVEMSLEQLEAVLEWSRAHPAEPVYFGAIPSTAKDSDNLRYISFTVVGAKPRSPMPGAGADANDVGETADIFRQIQSDWVRLHTRRDDVGQYIKSINDK